MGKFFIDMPRIISTGGAIPGLLQDTIKNFGHAIRLGTDVIRTNIGITGANKIVLYSNDIFNHCDMGKYGILSLNVHEFRTQYKNILNKKAAVDGMDDIDGVLPELEEALRAFPEQRFNVNCLDKSPLLMERFKEIIEEHAAHDRILVSSVSGYNTGWIRKEMPEVPVSFSFYGMIGFYGLFKSGMMFAKNKFAAQALIIPERIGASYFANSGLIEHARKRGIRVYINPVDTEKQARSIKEAGADGVITNDIPTIKRGFIE